jgi:hypothetical protein
MWLSHFRVQRDLMALQVHNWPFLVWGSLRCRHVSMGAWQLWETMKKFSMRWELPRKRILSSLGKCFWRELWQGCCSTQWWISEMGVTYFTLLPVSKNRTEKICMFLGWEDSSLLRTIWKSIGLILVQLFWHIFLIDSKALTITFMTILIGN